MDLKLQDKVAFVTGSGSPIGFGRAIALQLAEEGCHVVSADVDLPGAQETAALVEKLGRRALAVRMDVTDRAEVDAMVKKAVDEFGQIDILVNNAGRSSADKPFAMKTKADWDLDIGINLYGQMNVAQAVLPYMTEQKYGRIVNTSGGQGLPTVSTYGAAKAGVEAFTHSLAVEVAPLGIIVNGITPGLGETGLNVTTTEEHKEGFRRMSALHRLCTPQDVAPAVAFLASDVCSYMVGQWIRLATF
ncbi:MAG: SDR family oxidoreductase [Thermoleophilia bacterium]|nr:SDR family oxidoreductase [Thermoleophilia bacterium]